MEKSVISNKNIGLIHGSAGRILVDFLKIQYSDWEGFSQAESQLDLVTDEIIQTADLSFDSGICGIGWMVGHLKAIGILKVDIDEILEDMDDELYKDTLIMLATEQPDIHSYLGRINYYQSRYFISGLRRDPLRHFIHFECLKLLVNRLGEYLNTLSGQVEINAKEMLEASLIVAKFGYLMDMSIGEKLFEVPFYKSMEKNSEQLSKIVEMVQDGDSPIISQYLEISLILYLSAWIYGNPHWTLSLERIYSSLLKHENDSDIKYRCQLIMELFMKATINLDQLAKLLKMEDGRYWLLFLLTNRKGLKIIN